MQMYKILQISYGKYNFCPQQISNTDLYFSIQQALNSSTKVYIIPVLRTFLHWASGQICYQAEQIEQHT